MQVFFEYLSQNSFGGCEIFEHFKFLIFSHIRVHQTVFLTCPSLSVRNPVYDHAEYVYWYCTLLSLKNIRLDYHNKMLQNLF